MVTTKNDTKIPNSTTNIFTTDKTISLNDNLNYDWNQNFNFGCVYLLPCGLCMKTDKPCPKYSGQGWQPYVIYCNYTNNSSPQQTIVGTTNFTTGELKHD